MNPLVNLPKKLARQLKKIGAITIYLFGSRAKNTSGPLSDYDIAVLLNSSVSPKLYLNIRLKLIGVFSEYFKTNAVEVIILNEAPALLAMNVINGGKIFFEADYDLRVAFETKTLARYLDRVPYEQRHLDSLLKSI